MDISGLGLITKLGAGGTMYISKKIRYYNTATIKDISSNAKYVGRCRAGLEFNSVSFDGENITIIIIKGKNRFRRPILKRLHSMIVGYIPIILMPEYDRRTFIFPKCECICYRQTDKRVTIKMKVHKIKTSNLATIIVATGEINNK